MGVRASRASPTATAAAPKPKEKKTQAKTESIWNGRNIAIGAAIVGGIALCALVYLYRTSEPQSKELLDLFKRPQLPSHDEIANSTEAPTGTIDHYTFKTKKELLRDVLIRGHAWDIEGRYQLLSKFSNRNLTVADKFFGRNRTPIDGQIRAIAEDISSVGRQCMAEIAKVEKSCQSIGSEACREAIKPVHHFCTQATSMQSKMIESNLCTPIEEALKNRSQWDNDTQKALEYMTEICSDH